MAAGAGFDALKSSAHFKSARDAWESLKGARDTSKATMTDTRTSYPGSSERERDYRDAYGDGGIEDLPASYNETDARMDAESSQHDADEDDLAVW